MKITTALITQSLGLNQIANGSNAANTANTISTTTNSITTSERILTNAQIALQKASIATSSNLLANSLVRNESLNDSIARLGGENNLLTNILIQSFAETGAREIGHLAHTNQTDQLGNAIKDPITNEPLKLISQPVQLAAHGILGAGISAALGNDNIAGILSGAAAGVVGEYVADTTFRNGFTANNAITAGQVTGSLASLTTSLILGSDDEETVRNVQSGSFVSSNAIINNTLSTPDIGTAVPGLDDEDLEQIDRTRTKVVEATAEAAYEVSPMGVNKTIEANRGSEQSWAAGTSAVYKSGNEWNGVIDSKANNIGIANIAMKDGKLDMSKVGQPVQFE
ncbi:MAG: hypothetical protein A2887_02075 [Alphaproteobacteria bacterium RIFCSPLOWO2_01_FULL_40_26]|nr:MAG: hypothetical protein A3D15_02840 [Alphaproteobacteria bacterium RIFCSPHIGHO2_02_FULL_40_34]OFW85840.1 MAG: hypothetical protein A2794_01760 [Alphaproteobacteria bacterium RIFCSPHIGHO2_01_FULL_40_8]OFW94756.1 MAG: hypothetical protein A2887_02075 [Alphaproteobacteria bacterium RIFCSPLOWO2_01_FULL_40_26]OFX10384.1 MAG: hypothetical protein A3H30_03065 [Alphaproteobacteria bacterium RIFCSPLOWO2_02_FULL_40_19]OFX11265.1 MAG: hypothetical protein A3G22_05960 [Alphaproteobacteria bacterium RI